MLRRSDTDGTAVYHYDSGGRLIGERVQDSAFRKEYIYLNDIPVTVPK